MATLNERVWRHLCLHLFCTYWGEETRYPILCWGENNTISRTVSQHRNLQKEEKFTRNYDKAFGERLEQLGSYDLAKLAYYAFWQKLAPKMIIHFDMLDQKIKNAWVAASEAVIRGKLDYETNQGGRR